MRLLIQKVEVYWSRDEPEGFERGFSLSDQSVQSSNDWRHVVVVNETDGFDSEAVVDEPWNRPLGRDAGLFIERHDDGVDVHFEWSSAVGHPERGHTKAFSLEIGSWGRLEFTGRLPTESDWLSQHIIYNIAVLDAEPPTSLFEGTPKHVWQSFPRD